MLRTPRSLIANEPYEVGFTRHDGRFFNQPLPPVTIQGPGGQTLTLPAPQPALQADPTLGFDWVCQGYPLVITGNTSGQLLQADNYRNLLIIQNNSVATAPDVAPNLFIALDGPVQLTPFFNPVTSIVSSFAFNAITLVPGEGLVLDQRVPRNSIFSSWGVSTNTGGTVYTIGLLMYGRTTNAPPQPQGNQASSIFDLDTVPWYRRVGRAQG